MNNILFYLLPLFFITLFQNNCVAQNEYSENVSIYTDRVTYLAGESVFFTSYYPNFNNEDSINISHILYIEIYNYREVIQSSKVLITNKLQTGKIQLPEDCLSGNYFLRAYTKYRNNFPESHTNHLLISVINPNKAFPEEYKTSFEKYAIRKLPKSESENEYIVRINRPLIKEAKQLVLHSELAENQADNIIFDAKPLNRFILHRKDSLYTKLSIITHHNDSITLPLTNFIKHPASINPYWENEEVKVHINVAQETILNYGTDYKLLVKNSAFKTISDQLFNANENTTLTPNSEIFEKGKIYYFIIQDFNNLPLNLSALYIPNITKPTTHMSLSSKRAKSREALEISFPKNFSTEYATVLVKKANTLSSNYSPYLLSFSHKLIRSRITHYPVESKEMAQQINTALKFHQEELNSESFKNDLYYKFTSPLKHIPDIRELGLAGHAEYSNSGKPATGIDVFASVAYGTNQLHHQRTDDSGNFIFSLNNALGIQNVFISTSPKNGNIKLSVFNDFRINNSNKTPIPLVADTAKHQWFEELYFNKQIQSMVNKKDKKTTPPHSGTIVNFKGLEDYTVKTKDFVQMSSTVELFNEIVPFTKVTKINDSLQIRIFDKSTNSYLNNPLVLIDYMPVYYPDYVLRINPEKIKQINIFSQTFISGDFQYDGVVFITTNTNDFAGVKLPQNSVYHKYKGVQKFYPLSNKKYNTTEKQESRIPDFRNLLYYKSFSGIMPRNISFYTSDAKGLYEAVITGKDITGELFNQTVQFTIE
ncbi:MAG: hypothetical protein U9N85_05410 [Bacteroidota bacterium]|nr:hypothetical protein [Bacteroidota bacterium]